MPTWLGLTATVALATATVVVQSATAEAGLRVALSHLGSDRLVDVTLTDASSRTGYDGFQSSTPGQVRSQAAGLLALRSQYVVSGSFYQASRTGREVGPADRDLVPIAYYAGVQRHVRLVAGGFPELAADGRSGPALPVTASEAAASRVGLRVGETVCLVSPEGGTPVCFSLAGIWQPLDAGEPYWGREGVPGAALLIGEPEFFAVVLGQRRIGATGHAVFSPDLAAIRASEAEQVLDRFRRLRGLVTLRQPNVTVTTGLDTAVAAYQEQSRVASFAVQLVAAQLLLVVLLYVPFLGAHLVGVQRQAIAVWRGRGWSWTGVTRLLGLELAAVTAPAVLAGLAAGWWAAWGALALAYRPQPVPPVRMDLTGLWAAVAAVGLALAVLLLQAGRAARQEAIGVRRQTSRPPVLPWWRRRWLDLALGALALPLLVRSRVLGSAGYRAAGPDDPFQLLLPGFAVLLIAVASVRLIPLAASLLGLLKPRVEQLLAGLQITRHPGQHSHLAVLLTLTMALAVFAGVYAGTAPRNAADRADYAVGADLRATFGGECPAAETAAASLTPGTLGTAVYRGYARFGSAGAEGQVLGVDPFSFAPVVWTRPDLSRLPLREQLQELGDRETGGLLLPGGATSLSIWARGAGIASRLTARLSDAHGRPASVDFGPLDFSGWRRLEEPIQGAAGRPAQPLRFRELRVSAPSPSEPAATIALSRLAVSGPALADTVLERFGSTDDPRFISAGRLGPPTLWWSVHQHTGASEGAVHADLRFALEGRPTVAITLEPGGLGVSLRPPAGVVAFAGPGTAVPALATPATLRNQGLSVGQAFVLSVDNINVAVAVVDVVDHFPTLYPEAQDVLVLDRDPLLAQLGQAGHPRPWPNEVWVRALAGDAVAATHALGRAPGVLDVLERRAAEATALGNPELLALEANLLLGLGTAGCLGLLGFVVHFVLLGRSRAADYAILEANGMRRRTVRGALAVEQGLLLGFCLVAGLSLGLALAWILLPALQLGTDLGDVVPPTVITLDPVPLAAASAMAVAVALAAGRLAARAASQPRLMDELRALG